MKRSKKEILELFLCFLKIGAFTFGGGYAMLPMIRRELAEKKQWITEEEILEITAIAEATPGPIAVNAATFVGYRTAGFWGAFFATCGVVLPAFLIISAISGVLQVYQENRIVAYAFYGIRAGVLALILHALWSMAKECPKGILSYLLAGAAFLGTTVFGISSIAVILFCAAVGLGSAFWTERRSK